jgi:hypothetical protein
MATTKDNTERKLRKSVRAPKKTAKPSGLDRATNKEERFTKEGLRLAVDLVALIDGTQRRPRARLEHEIWMRLPCAPGRPCSRTHTCASHSVLVDAWSAAKRHSGISLGDPPFSVSFGKKLQIQDVTRNDCVPQTAKMKDLVERRPEQWPSQDTWRVVEREIRECVDTIVGIDPKRAAAIGRLIRVLRATSSTPANFQHKVATIAIDCAWDLTMLFEQSLSVGISAEELTTL